MQHLLRFFIVGSILLTAQAHASQIIYKVLEQDDEGVAGIVGSRCVECEGGLQQRLNVR